VPSRSFFIRANGGLLHNDLLLGMLQLHNGKRAPKSPNQRSFFIFDSTTFGNPAIFTVSVDGGTPKPLIVDSRCSATPSASLDGHWVSPHWRRERPDLIRGHAHVRPRALARCQHRIRNKRFICVENRVARDAERTCQSACGRQARSRGQLLFENRLPQLIVDLVVQRTRRLRFDPQGRHGRVRWALQSGTACGESGSLPTTILARQLQPWPSLA
jgi:hypothetical protein